MEAEGEGEAEEGEDDEQVICLCNFLDTVGYSDVTTFNDDLTNVFKNSCIYTQMYRTTQKNKWKWKWKCSSNDD